MKWEGQERSDNVEDARGGGGRGGFRVGGGSVGIGGLIIAVVAGWIFGINPLTILGVMEGAAPTTQSAPAGQPPAGDKEAEFVSVVLRDTEKVWGQVFSQSGKTYVVPKLRLFSGREATACGTGQSAMGPFYCPGDQKVYIDLDFFQTLSQRLGAPGDFAQAYVIAHEVGHHVQNLLGISDKVDAMRRRGSEAQANAMSVRVELQADCLAGLWAFHSQKSKGWLDQSDIDEAMNAASKIGDDTLQRRSQGTIVPESFTHGSSAQRVQWFKRGLQSGRLDACNTFEGGAL